MADNKFLKAYCKKTNRYFGLELKKRGTSYRVVNMIPLSADEAKLISSEVEQAHFETNENLIPCASCGKRRVGGCSCAKKKGQCGRDMKYRFDCIYCDELTIDYSLPTASEVGARAGETVTLSQGQEVKIRYADDRPLKTILVGVGWDPAPGYQDDSIDVDSSVVVMDQNAKKSELVYFGHLEHSSGCVLHHGDNLTGRNDEQAADDENITVHLDRVPRGLNQIVFLLNIYRCSERGQTLDKIRNLYIRLYDPDSGKVLVEYQVRGNMGTATAMVIGAALKKGDSWSFKAIGRSLRVENLQELVARCVEYL